MRLVWNGIVKDEIERIDRCVMSLLAGGVEGAIVCDTGSTDGTPGRIMELFTAAEKPCEIHHAEFQNFSQARNEALRVARDSKMAWDYLLLADADMELKTEKTDWLNGEAGAAYDMQQKAGGLAYWNRRLLARWAVGEYRGVTHEYLDVPGSGQISGAYFIDHADGANRPGKILRDIELLREALYVETNPGLVQRYHFYLGNSYFDLHDWRMAAHHYKQRMALGGWVEEVWYAHHRYAQCLREMGKNEEYLWEMLQVYNRRPQRAEALYDLARTFRERGDNHASLLFSAPGMDAKRPDDVLFVPTYPYETGLKEEFSICAFYDERHRRRGKDVINQLALARSGTDQSRDQARNNLYWYLSPLSEQVPSFKPARIAFEPPDNYVAMNPSVINYKGRPLILVRTVNYAITPEGRYVSRTNTLASDGTPVIHTRNWLCHVDCSGSVVDAQELLNPDDWPQRPKFPLVLGFEDSRLYSVGGGLMAISTVRELNEHGWCEQVVSRIESTGPQKDFAQYKTWRVVEPPVKLHQKNWMPWADSGFWFVYRLNKIIHIEGNFAYDYKVDLDIGHISGGSQVIEVKPQRFLALVHEARYIPGRVNRYYQHRFVLFDHCGRLLNISKPFYLHDRQIEFVAGLAKFADELMISYGIRDEEAWIATMKVDEVMRLLT